MTIYLARTVGDFEISLEAAQIWKGKRSFSVSEETKLEKKKTPIPLPSEATHFGIEGKVRERDPVLIILLVLFLPT